MTFSADWVKSWVDDTVVCHDFVTAAAAAATANTR